MNSNRSIFEKIILGIFAVYALLLLVVRIAVVFSWLPETGGVSINMMYGIMQLTHTGVLYTSPEEPPFSIIQYMPLHFYIVSGIGHLLNIQNDLHQMMVLNRILCLLAGILYSYLIFYGLRKIFPASGKRIAIGFGLLMFILIPSHNYSRLDNLYLSFILFAIISYLDYLKLIANNSSATNKKILFAGIFCCLAMLTKQTGIITTGLFAGWTLFMLGKPKDFFKFISAVFIPFIILILLILPHNFYDFKLNVIDGINNGVDWNWFYQVIVKYYLAETGFLIAFGIYMAFWLLKDRNDKMQLFISAAIIYFLSIALIMSIKLGSNPFYYLEFTFMVIFGIGFLLQKNPDAHKPFLPYITLLVPFYLMSTIHEKGWHDLGRMKKAKKDYAECLIVADYVNHNLIPGNFIYSNFHMENSLNLMIGTPALFPCREVAFFQTWPRGVFKFTKFNQLVSENKLQFVIAEKDKFPDKVLDTPILNFELDTVIGKYEIFSVREIVPSASGL